MPQNFLACDREQPFLLPPDVREWLPEDHLAWFVIDAVGVIDTAVFYAAYRQDGHGRAACEPSMMVALLLYCWSRGVRSARRIERACLEDVACRVIAAQQRPDHATIARFVVRHERALGELFGEILTLCADAGLATVDVLAIDGTKVAANANRDRTLDYEQLAKTIVAEQIATDAAEDDRFGPARGDELPPELAQSKGRLVWLREAKRRLDERRADEARPIPRSRRERLTDAKQRLDRELEAERRGNEAYEAYRARGVGRSGRRFSPAATPKPYTLPATPQGKVNITDPDSKLVKGMRGWIQGYNAQAVCNNKQLIVAAEVMTASPDFGHLGPMLAAARRELTAAGISRSLDVVVADSGYWHLEQMNEITGDGIPVLIPPDSSRRANKPKRPGWDGGAYDFMRSVLCTELGGRALQATRPAHRADLRQHQVQPRLHQIPPTRPLRRPNRMATDGHHSQPRQAPPALQSPRRLTAGRATDRQRSARATTLRDSLRRKQQCKRLRKARGASRSP
jgi:transposase